MRKCMSTTMLGQTAYTLKHIEANEEISISKLRKDIVNGNLKAYKESNYYYVLEADLFNYLDSQSKRRANMQEQENKPDFIKFDEVLDEMTDNCDECDKKKCIWGYNNCPL